MPQAKSVYFFYAQNVLKRTKYDQRIYSDKLTTHFCTMEPRGLSSHSSTRKSSLESLVSPKIVSEPRLEPMIWYWEKICRMFVTWHVSLKCSEWGSKETTLSLLQPCCYFNKLLFCIENRKAHYKWSTICAGRHRSFTISWLKETCNACCNIAIGTEHLVCTWTICSETSCHHLPPPTCSTHRK